MPGAQVVLVRLVPPTITTSKLEIQAFLAQEEHSVSPLLLPQVRYFIRLIVFTCCAQPGRFRSAFQRRFLKCLSERRVVIGRVVIFAQGNKMEGG